MWPVGIYSNAAAEPLDRAEEIAALDQLHQADDVAAIRAHRADPAFAIVEDFEALRRHLPPQIDTARHAPGRAPQLDVSAGDIGQRIARLDVVEVLRRETAQASTSASTAKSLSGSMGAEGAEAAAARAASGFSQPILQDLVARDDIDQPDDAGEIVALSTWTA